VAVLLAACGSSNQSTTSSAARPADTKLAQQILARQLPLVRRSLSGATERATRATGTATCSTAIAVFAHAARARSPTFSYRHELQLRTTAYVFADEGDASKALSAYATKPSQSCIARSTTDALERSGYSTAAPRVATTSLGGLGQAAVGSEVTIPSRFRGRTFTWHLDASAVRQGRVINVLDTLAGRSSANYNRRLAAAFAKIAADAQ
jgi:hypothetical protein